MYICGPGMQLGAVAAALAGHIIPLTSHSSSSSCSSSSLWPRKPRFSAKNLPTPLRGPSRPMNNRSVFLQSDSVVPPAQLLLLLLLHPLLLLLLLPLSLLPLLLLVLLLLPFPWRLSVKPYAVADTAGDGARGAVDAVTEGLELSHIRQTGADSEEARATDGDNKLVVV